MGALHFVVELVFTCVFDPGVLIFFCCRHNPTVVQSCVIEKTPSPKKHIAAFRSCLATEDTVARLA